jgi:hypothetical protein
MLKKLWLGREQPKLLFSLLETVEFVKVSKFIFIIIFHYYLIAITSRVEILSEVVYLKREACNKVRFNWLYNRAYIIYDEEIESTSARFLLMKFFTFIYVLERRFSLLDRAFV